MWYLINTNFTRLYQQQYGLDTGTTGLCYLPLAGGAMVGCVLGGRVSDQNYRRRVAKAKENNQEVYPEMRMGSPLFYGSLFLQLAICIVYGWCLEFNVHYAVGIVMLFFSKIDIMSAFYGNTNMQFTSWLFSNDPQCHHVCLLD